MFIKDVNHLFLLTKCHLREGPRTTCEGRSMSVFSREMRSVLKGCEVFQGEQVIAVGQWMVALAASISVLSKVFAAWAEYLKLPVAYLELTCILVIPTRPALHDNDGFHTRGNAPAQCAENNIALRIFLCCEQFCNEYRPIWEMVHLPLRQISQDHSHRGESSVLPQKYRSPV